MALDFIIEDVTELEESLRDFYVEKDGKWMLDVTGAKPQKEFDAVYKSLTESREDTRKAKTALDAFGDIDGDGFNTMRDELEELRARGVEGGVDDAKLEEIIAARSKPVLRDNEKLTAKLAESLAREDQLNGQLINRDRDGVITELAGERIQTQFMRDLKTRARMDLKYDPEREAFYDEMGSTAEEWANRQLEETPGWSIPSTGAGAQGGRGRKASENCFDPASPAYNMTEQMRIMAEDPRRAEKLKNQVPTQ